MKLSWDEPTTTTTSIQRRIEKKNKAVRGSGWNDPRSAVWTRKGTVPMNPTLRKRRTIVSHHHISSRGTTVTERASNRLSSTVTFENLLTFGGVGDLFANSRKEWKIDGCRRERANLGRTNDHCSRDDKTRKKVVRGRNWDDTRSAAWVRSGTVPINRTMRKRRTIICHHNIRSRRTVAEKTSNLANDHGSRCSNLRFEIKFKFWISIQIRLMTGDTPMRNPFKKAKTDMGGVPRHCQEGWQGVRTPHLPPPGSSTTDNVQHGCCRKRVRSYAQLRAAPASTPPQILNSGRWLESIWFIEKRKLLR